MLTPKGDAVQTGWQYIRKVTRILHIFSILAVLFYHFIFQTPLSVPFVVFKPEVFRAQRSLGNAGLLCCTSTILKLTGAWEVYKRLLSRKIRGIKRQYYQGMSLNREFYQQLFPSNLLSQMSSIHVLFKHFLKFILTFWRRIFFFSNFSTPVFKM